MSGSLFEDYRAALRRGHVAVLAGDLDAALAAYDAAARLVPDRPLPLASRGTVLHRLDRWPEAAEAFERALGLAPDDEASLRARATARAERGLRSGAASDFERLAFVLDVSGRAREAADAARRAVDLEVTPAREALAARLGAGVPSSFDHDVDPRLAFLEAMPAVPAADRTPDPVDAVDALRPEREADAEASDAAAARHDPVVEGVDGAEGETEPEGEHVWPPVDLPSPPPAPIEGPPPDPERLLAEAALVLESGEVEGARDLMLTAVQVHREAGRTDAALEVCLNLLSIAPGDPRVHLAIANLQLDRDWTAVAKEKLELLVRLTSLTGDTQAEADVRGLASERLRDEPAASTPGR